MSEPRSSTSDLLVPGQRGGRLVHVAVVGRLVAAPCDLADHVLVRLRDVTGSEEGRGHFELVQHVEDARHADARAVLPHRQQTGAVGRLRVDVDRPRHAVDVEGQHHCAPGIAGPDSAHGPPPSRVETLHSRHSHCIPRHSRDGGNPGVEGMGPRLHGNDGRQRVPTVIPAKPVLRISVIPAQEDPCTTVIPARRESRGRRDGFPSSRERRAAARPYRHSCQTSTSHFRHSRAGRPLHNRHSRDGGNPGAAGMGSRLHGNDGRPRVPTVIPAKPVLRISVIPAQEDPCTTVIPAKAGTRGGMGMGPAGTTGGTPSSATNSRSAPRHTGYRRARFRSRATSLSRRDLKTPAYPVIPAKAGIQGWRGWVPVSTGTTGGSASLPSFPSTQNFTYPSFPRRKTHCTTVIPAKAGIQGWRGWVPVSTGTTGGTPSPPSIPPARREYFAYRRKTPAQPSFREAGIQGWRGWVRLHGNDECAPRLRRESTSQTRVYRIDVYENWKA